MPFRLDEYEEAFRDFMGHSIHETAIARSEVLSQVTRVSTRGPTASIVQDKSGEDVDLKTDPIEFEIDFSRIDVRQGRSEKLLEQIDQASAQLERGLSEMFYSTISTVTDVTGNVVDAGGQPLSFDLIYEALDQLEWSLDENDELQMPTLVMHPETLKKVPALTEEEIARLKELSGRKKEELLAGKRSRRLS